MLKNEMYYVNSKMNFSSKYVSTTLKTFALTAIILIGENQTIRYYILEHHINIRYVKF